MNVAIDPGRCTLVLVDYQQRLLPAIHRGMEVAAEAVRLADCARALGVRVVGTEHHPAGLGPNAEAILERCDRIVTAATLLQQMDCGQFHLDSYLSRKENNI